MKKHAFILLVVAILYIIIFSPLLYIDYNIHHMYKSVELTSSQNSKDNTSLLKHRLPVATESSHEDSIQSKTYDDNSLITTHPPASLSERADKMHRDFIEKTNSALERIQPDFNPVSGVPSYITWFHNPHRHEAWMNVYLAYPPTDAEMEAVCSKIQATQATPSVVPGAQPFNAKLFVGSTDRMNSTIHEAMTLSPSVEDGLAWWLSKNPDKSGNGCVYSMAECMLATASSGGNIPSEVILYLAPISILETYDPIFARRLVAHILARGKTQVNG